MHGTTAYTIQSACASTGGRLLPTGELLKRKIVPLSGELREGITANGVNQVALSGVSLPAAPSSVAYAKGFKGFLSQPLTDEERCTQFLSEPLSSSSLYYHSAGMSALILSLLRIQLHSPQNFNRQQWKDKLEEIYEQLRNIFHKRPERLFAWHDNCFTYEFYSSLRSIETFRGIALESFRTAGTT